MNLTNFIGTTGSFSDNITNKSLQIREEDFLRELKLNKSEVFIILIK